MLKKGLSDIVTNVLIILLVIVAVGIVWAFVSPVVKNASSGITTEQYSANFEIVANSVMVNSSLKTLNLSVRRNAGGSLPGSIRFILEDTSSQSRSFKLTIAPPFNELESKPFFINYSNSSLGNLTRISILPVFTLNGKEVDGGVTSTYEFATGSIIQQTSQPVCVANTTQSCTTTADYPGNQTCNVAGTGWNACITTLSCGDGIVTPEAEQCESGNLTGQTCVSRGFYGGNLACTSCQFDTSACYAGFCGDGATQDNELCDWNTNSTTWCQDCGGGRARSCLPSCQGYGSCIPSIACFAASGGNEGIDA